MKIDVSTKDIIKALRLCNDLKCSECPLCDFPPEEAKEIDCIRQLNNFAANRLENFLEKEVDEK